MNRYTEETLALANEALPSFRYVTIDWERLREVAEQNAFRLFTLPRWDFENVHPVSHAAAPSHLFAHNLINFRFGCGKSGQIVRFEVNDDAGRFRGSFAMGHCFYRYFGEAPITAERMRPLVENFGTFREAFRGINEMPMLRERFEFLQEGCAVLEKEFDGDVMNLIEESGYRAFGDERHPGIVELLIKHFPRSFGQDYYVDQHHYFVPNRNTPNKFHFLKRPQLFAMMYHCRAAASDHALEALSDAHEIGPIIDYIVPRSYAADKCTHYCEKLTNFVAEAKTMLRHHRPEVEIRLAGMLAHAEELRVVNELREGRGLATIHVGHLDYYRFQHGGMAKHLNHHLCCTTDY